MNSLTRTIEILLVLSILTCFFIILTGCQQSDDTKKVGIIVPIEHKAMDEIVEGFTQTIRMQSSHPVQFKIANARGDMNLQRAIIQQMQAEGLDVVAPIGTTTTQMTIAMIHKQPIVSLAASFSEIDRKQLKSCNVSVVHDEISIEQIVNFIHQVYPHLTQIVLIHSASEKIFPDVEMAVAAAKKVGVHIVPMMVTTLNELYTTANAISPNTQGILVLKDSLIVSGINTLEKIAEKRSIPLITSDQGSVQEGAAFALGVHERDIGVEGAKLAVAILNGNAACDLPIVEMKELTVFFNPTILAKENQSTANILQAAKNEHYVIEDVTIMEKK